MTQGDDRELTAREREIVELLLDGNTPKEAAKELGLSLYTVYEHLFNARRRQDLPSTYALMARVNGRYWGDRK